VTQSQGEHQASWLQVVVVYVALVAVTGVAGLLMLVFPHLMNWWVSGVVLQLVAYALIAAVIVVALHRIPESARSMFGATAAPTARQILVAVASAAGALLLVVGVVPWVFGVPLTDITGTSNAGVAASILNIVGLLVVVGPIEELAFRGYLFGRLRQLVRPWIAVVIQAILFGLWHIPTHPSLASVGLVTAFGLLFGFIRWKVPGATILALGVGHGLYDVTLAVLASVL